MFQRATVNESTQKYFDLYGDMMRRLERRRDIRVRPSRVFQLCRADQSPRFQEVIYSISIF